MGSALKAAGTARCHCYNCCTCHKSITATGECSKAAVAARVISKNRDHRADIRPGLLDDLATIGSRPRPECIPPERWAQLLADATALLNCWGNQAASLGWSILDLVGVHRIVPLARYDLMGLVIVLDGADVVAMSADHADILTRTERASAISVTPA
jgi:hypothetical protein